MGHKQVVVLRERGMPVHWACHELRVRETLQLCAGGNFPATALSVSVARGAV
jgi:hypothetical protein